VCSGQKAGAHPSLSAAGEPCASQRCHGPTPLSADRLTNSGLAGGCRANRRGGSRGSGPDVSFRTKTRRREGEERALARGDAVPAGVAGRIGDAEPGPARGEAAALGRHRPRHDRPAAPADGPTRHTLCPASGPGIMFRFKGLAAKGHRAQRNGIQGSRAQDRDDDAQRRSRRRAGAPRMEGGSRCQRANRNVEGTSAVGKRKGGSAASRCASAVATQPKWPCRKGTANRRHQIGDTTPNRGHYTTPNRGHYTKSGTLY